MKSAMRFVLVMAVIGVLAGTASAFKWKEHIRVKGTGSEYLGYSVGAAGDVDQDGILDMVVGAPQIDAAYVVSGVDGSIIHTLNGWGSGSFGYSVDGAGDVNDDGYPDIIVGEYYSDIAHVFSGKDGSTIHTLYALNYGWGESFGYSVSGAGDVDDDGYDDVIVGAYSGYDLNKNWTGYAIVFSGQTGQQLYVFSGNTYGYYFGWSVDCAGDVDDDGIPDLIVGGLYEYSTHNVYGYDDYWGTGTVFSGASGKELYKFTGDNSWYGFGYSVAGIGDVDDDGYDDVAVGSPWEIDQSYNQTGMVRVYSGYDGSVLNTFYGENYGDDFGYSLAGAGDLNADGLPDMFVGADLAQDSKGSQVGAVYAYSAVDGELIVSVFGSSGYSYFGCSVAGLGDVNDDGRADLGVGEYYALAGAGSAYIYVTPSPKGTIVINDGAVATAKAEVELDITWIAGEATVKDMRLRDAGAEKWGEWTALAATKTWTLPAGEEEKTVEIQFRDNEGLLSKAISDSIYLDLTAPSGSINVEGGADWTNKSQVTIDLQFLDGLSGVAQVRARVRNGTWSSWSDDTASIDVSMPTGDGPKTFEAQARDYAGNESAIASDGIGLDTLAPPSGSILIDGGYPFSADWTVSISLSASDNTNGSGVDAMKFRRLGDTNYGEWEPYETEIERVLPSGEGNRGFFVIFRDRAGNESREFFDGIMVDISPPQVFSLSVSGRYAFFVAGETIYIRAFAADNTEGSGIAEMRATFDEGSTWTDWAAYNSVSTPLLSPAGSGFYDVHVQVRDAAGNTSAISTASAPVYLVESTPPHLGMAGSYAGYLSGAADEDALTFDLIAGDVVKITARGKPANPGQSFPLSLDLLTPSATLISVTPGATFTIPQGGTGRYLLQVGQGGGPGSYSVKVAVKRPKTTTAYSRTLNPKSDGLVEFVFQGTDGILFTANLHGDGVTPASFFLLGPDGPVPFEMSGGPGNINVQARFGQGVGLYRLGVAATGPVLMNFTAAPPRKSKMEEP